MGMVAPRAIAKFNRHVTNRVLGPLVPHLPGFGFVEHKGRRSGRSYRTPVNMFRTDGGYAVALTYGPGSDWVRNVVAAGGCDAVIGGKTVHLTDPQVVHDPARSRVPRGVRPMLTMMGVKDFLTLHAG
jgi:deazaflavin-dependent oxidoreductase (nitroreductase family)